VLEILNVSKSFGETQVLAPTTLAMPKGRTTVLIGPSGCGKSTLLRLMIGVLEPDSGCIRFDGIELTPDNVLLMRRRIGYVLQDGGLFPHLTAHDNAALMPRYLRWTEDRVRSRIAELAELTRLPVEMLVRYPAQLSGGQRQRVGIMRALMLDPEVLLLDEPMGALDPLVRYDLQQDLRAIFLRLRKTTVLVTHDMGEAEFFGDLVVLLDSGRIVQQGKLEDMIRTPADPFVTRFIKAQRVLPADWKGTVGADTIDVGQ
jgi:osmoprotectant transport system ATP-binding protein